MCNEAALRSCRRSFSLCFGRLGKEPQAEFRASCEAVEELE